MEIEITDTEQTLILLLRSFDFLRREEYVVNELSLYGPYSSLCYKKQWSSLRVCIEWAPENNLKIVIKKRRLLFDKEFSLHKAFRIINKNYVSEYEHPPIYITMEKVINYHSEFIQQHLMPVIRGQMWIDELGKKEKTVRKEDNINSRFIGQLKKEKR